MKTSNRSPFHGKSKFAASGEQRRGKPRFKSAHKNEYAGDKPKRFYPEKPRAEKSDRDQKRNFKLRPEKPERDKPSGFKPRRPGRERAFEPRRTSAPPAPPQRERDSVLVWGMHAVQAAWLNPKRRCYRLWVTEAAAAAFEPSITEARDVLLLKRPDPKRVDRQELDRLTPPASVHQGIVLEMTALPEPSLHDIINRDAPPDLLIMLDQVTDPHNVGAILRSAAAFGAGAVIMTERNAPTTTGVLAKAASGALEHVPQIHVVNLSRALDDLKQAGYWSIGLAEEGEKDLGSLDLTGRTVIVLGAEGEGLRQLTRKKCDELARLPTGGAIGSLNVSNAAAVALYEVRRQKKAIS